MNLYSRLYKYKPDNKSQMENFCTEALCDILNRLSHEQMMHLFNGIKLPELDCEQSLVWKTQYRIKIADNQRSAIPDLVGVVDGKIKYIVEVKIDAGFTDDKKDENEQDSSGYGQLQKYGQWLKNNKNAHDSYLILLTDKTHPNADFFDENVGTYGVKRKNRLLIYWQNIYDIFTRLNDEGNVLINEFNKFLVEKRLAMELPRRSDFAVLELMMSGSGSRLQSLMTILNSKIKEKYFKCELLSFGDEDKYKHDGWAFIWDRGLNRSFVNFKKLPYFFDWGFHFPEYDSESEDNDITIAPCFYIELCCENENDSSFRKVIELLDKNKSLIGVSKDDFVFDKNGVLVDGGSLSIDSITIEELLTENYNFERLFDFVTKFMDKIINALKTLNQQ